MPLSFPGSVNRPSETWPLLPVHNPGEVPADSRADLEVDDPARRPGRLAARAAVACNVCFATSAALSLAGAAICFSDGATMLSSGADQADGWGNVAVGVGLVAGAVSWTWLVASPVGRAKTARLCAYLFPSPSVPVDASLA